MVYIYWIRKNKKEKKVGKQMLRVNKNQDGSKTKNQPDSKNSVYEMLLLFFVKAIYQLVSFRKPLPFS